MPLSTISVDGRRSLTGESEWNEMTSKRLTEGNALSWFPICAKAQRILAWDCAIVQSYKVLQICVQRWKSEAPNGQMGKDILMLLLLGNWERKFSIASCYAFLMTFLMCLFWLVRAQLYIKNLMWLEPFLEKGCRDWETRHRWLHILGELKGSSTTRQYGKKNQ